MKDNRTAVAQELYAIRNKKLQRSRNNVMHLHRTEVMRKGPNMSNISGDYHGNY